MDVKKTRWSKVYESSEEELVDLLQAMNITAVRWSADEFQFIPSTQFDVPTQIWCVEGSIVYTFGEKKISAQPGDALLVPAGTAFSAEAGIAGCACYQTVI